MTPQDCRAENSFNKTRMFGSADFASDIVKQKWDRVKIICRQPFRRNVQMGISFVCIKTSGNEEIDSPESKLTTPKSIKSIQKHFFGKISSSDGKTQELKSRLMKIASSGENGVHQEQCLNRNAKLVLAATGSVNKFAVPPKIKSPTEGKSKLYSMHIAQQMAPQFEEDALSFLDNYEFKREELDKITIADVRHKFEKKLKRKLTADEKRLFIKLSSDYICEVFMSKDVDAETGSSVHKPSDVNKKPNDVKQNTTKAKEKVSVSIEQTSSSSNSLKRLTGPSYKNVDRPDSMRSPPREKSRSFVSKSVCSRPVNPLPSPPADDQWLSCSTPPSSGKRKRDSSGSDKKLNRGAKRQQLEEEERNWLGMEEVKSNWVSTAASPTGSTPGGQKINRGKSGKTDQESSGKNIQSSSAGLESKQAAKGKASPITVPDDPVFEEYSLDSPPCFVECPICSQMFPQGSIEVHAAVCLDSISC
nr:uncharacterized protein LOC111111498 isoform X3 [Crassostrea virginica]XP_022304225.1 uncharacterized protein LOC111111498 isoform X3 [Crassostrea virginica]